MRGLVEPATRPDPDLAVPPSLKNRCEQRHDALRRRASPSGSWPSGWSTTTASTSSHAVSQKKSEPGRNRKSVSFARTLSPPLGTTSGLVREAARTERPRRDAVRSTAGCGGSSSARSAQSLRHVLDERAREGRAVRPGPDPVLALGAVLGDVRFGVAAVSSSVTQQRYRVAPAIGGGAARLTRVRGRRSSEDARAARGARAARRGERRRAATRCARGACAAIRGRLAEGRIVARAGGPRRRQRPRRRAVCRRMPNRADAVLTVPSECSKGPVRTGSRGSTDAALETRRTGPQERPRCWACCSAWRASSCSSRRTPPRRRRYPGPPGSPGSPTARRSAATPARTRTDVGLRLQP